MPSTELRQNVLRGARSLVIKLGTQILTGRDGLLDIDFVAEIATQAATLHERGVKIAIVTSGAVGSGMGMLRLPKRPRDVAALQAVAAVGQPQLVRYWGEGFARHGLGVGQLLLTRSDFEDRARFLNIRNCVSHLQSIGCIPIINENDTVAVDELRFGDNDMLAALLGNALRADAVVLLTGVAGLLDAQSQRIDLVTSMQEVAGLARQEKSALGTGGMSTKLQAASLLADAGELAIIAPGRMDNVLLRLLDGEKVGTVFLPAPRKMDARRRWIGLTKRPAGSIALDDGAVRAVCKLGKSLLASGITGCQGAFDRGAVLAVKDMQGREVARGLTNYSSDEIELIKGKQSIQFEKLLGRSSYPEVIHRDNLVIVGK